MNLQEILKSIEKIGWSITSLVILLLLLFCIVGGCYAWVTS